jgi:hypothetical protein
MKNIGKTEKQKHNKKSTISSIRFQSLSAMPIIENKVGVQTQTR